MHVFERCMCKLLSIVDNILLKCKQQYFFVVKISIYIQKHYLREVFLNYFILKNDAVEMHCLLINIYSEHVLLNITC